MACCGSKRNAYALQSKSMADGQQLKSYTDAYFEYTGETALSVTGSISRINYRFKRKGDRQLIDYRDVNGMMALPFLQKVKRG